MDPHRAISYREGGRDRKRGGEGRREGRGKEGGRRGGRLCTHLGSRSGESGS